MDGHHIANYCIGAAALLTAITAVGVANHRPPQIERTVVQASQIAPQARPSRAAWPSLGQAATIKIGETLAGARSKPAATIYCNSVDCDALMHDIDDAFQIADWPTDFERGYVDAESDRGLFVGPASNATAQLIALALRAGGLQPTHLPDMPPGAIVIGKKP